MELSNLTNVNKIDDLNMIDYNFNTTFDDVKIFKNLEIFSSFLN
jgi:hypothetical protein